VILKNSKLLAESWFISCELLAGTWQLSNAFIALELLMSALFLTRLSYMAGD